MLKNAKSHQKEEKIWKKAFTRYWVKLSSVKQTREGQRSGTGIFVFLVLSMSTDSAGPPKNNTDKKLH